MKIVYSDVIRMEIKFAWMEIDIILLLRGGGNTTTISSFYFYYPSKSISTVLLQGCFGIK